MTLKNEFKAPKEVEERLNIKESTFDMIETPVMPTSTVGHILPPESPKLPGANIQAIHTTNSFPPISTESDQLNTLWKQCKIFLESGLLPEMIKTPAQAFTIASYGKALGIEPIIALKEVYVVKGKPSMSATLMKAFVHKKLPNALFHIKTSNEKECEIEVARDKSLAITPYRFTIEDAVRAGLRGDNWTKYPRAMLRSRCITEVCRAEFSDCFLGSIYDENEIKEIE
jgi:hypothetical protein